MFSNTNAGSNNLLWYYFHINSFVLFQTAVVDSNFFVIFLLVIALV